MSPTLQTNPTEVLKFESSLSSSTRQIILPEDIAFGASSHGGFLASLMTKHAVLHAAQNPKTKYQTDVRSAYIQYYRPIFPASDPHIQLELREVSIGKGWSTFRVELTQGSKVAASADVTVTNFEIPGKTLSTHWGLSPPAPKVDLAKLETMEDPNWACYHTAFRPDGFRRAQAYVNIYIPREVPPQVKFVEQWMSPGWDCTPSGSRDTNTKIAKWTNDLILFAADFILPVQENLRPTGEPSLGSLASVLAFAVRQEQARKEGRSNWRELNDDGHLPNPGLFKDAMIHVTLSMSTEIKKRLPEDGVRWLYTRTEAKKLEGSRIDMETLLFDEAMDLVAISHQAAWIVTGMEKTKKSSSL